MPYLKKAVKFLLFGLAFIFVFILIYLSTGFFLSRLTTEKESSSKGDIAIYIKTNGVHTDIVVPTKNEQMDWSDEVKYQYTADADSSSKYLGMGWGDRGFYLETPTWADLKASVAFKAAFALSTTAIHATYYKRMHENDSCRKIMISEKQYTRLINYIVKSFRKDENGHFINIKTQANYGKLDAFYEANGSYSMIHTCNTWTNNALKICGQKACWWTPFDTGMFLIYNEVD